MFEKGLMEEFDNWLDHTEWTQEEFDKIEKLTEEDKTLIIDKVLNDNALTREMFNCFEWYLNKYLAAKENE